MVAKPTPKPYPDIVSGCQHSRTAICARCADLTIAVTMPPGERRRGLKRRRRVVFRAPLNAFTGYGLYAENIVRGLAGLRHDVVIRPAMIDEKFGRIGQFTRRRIVHEIQPEEWELLLFPPNAPVTEGKRTIYSTMWETDRLSSEQVASLNAAECVIVPCA